MRDLAFLLVFLGTVPFMFRSAMVGVMMWAYTAFLSLDDYVFGFLVGKPLNKIVAGITIFAMLFDKRRTTLRFDLTFCLMIALLILATISSALSPAFKMDDVWMLHGKLAKILVYCTVIRMVVIDRFRLHALLLAICFGMGFNAADEALKFFVSGGSHHVLGLKTIGDNNQFALVVLMIMPILYFLYKYMAVKIVKICTLFGLFLSVISIMATNSRGGFIGMGTFAIVLILLNKQKLRSLLIVAAIGTIMVQVAPPTWFERIHTIQSASGDDSFMGRVKAWKMSILVAEDRPLIGGGMHAIQDRQVWDLYWPRFNELSWIPSNEEYSPGKAAHSIFFEVLGDLGFTGLFLFTSMLLAGYRTCSGVKRLTKKRPDLHWMYDLATMLQISLVVYIISGAALSMAYTEMLYVMLTIGSVLHRFAEEAIKEDALVPPDAATVPERHPLEARPRLAQDSVDLQRPIA